MDDLLLYGGPGTGKTRSGIEWLLQRVEEGADVERAAFVSYTNAAVDEAKERICRRFQVDPDDLPYCRTLHALAKRVLGVTEQGWLADERLGEFGETYGYNVKGSRRKADEDGVEERLSDGDDAPLLDVWDFSRQRLITDPFAGYREFAAYDPDATARLPFPRFLAFVNDYENWKRRNGLRDYTDLLLELTENPTPLPVVSVAVIDEAQDLSPLMWRVADILFANAELRATLGDDDQAIYSWSGADPALMNGRTAREVVKLRQSHRLPRALAENATWIISQNDNREPKALEPVGEGGIVDRVSLVEHLPLDNGQTWFLLVRNWKLLPQFLRPLEDLGLPYAIRGGRYSPWSDRGPLRAAQAVWALSGGRSITLAELWPLVDRTPAANSKKTGVWAYGTKKRLEDECANYGSRPVTWRDLLSLGMTEEGFGRLMRRDLFMLEGKVTERDIRAYETAIRRGHWEKPVRLTLGSVHSVKGKEAENVAVLLACTGGPARAMLRPWRAEEERRVAYVAATRAQRRFYGVLPVPSGGLFPWELCGV